MTISTTILLLIFILVLVSLALSLNVVQNKVAAHASKLASEYIGTKVSLGYINITMLGQIEVRDFLTLDLQGDTLLYVKTLNTPIIGTRISDRTVELGKSSVEGGELNLLQREGGMNIRQIVNIITPKTSKNAPIVIDIEGVKLNDFDIRIAQLKKKNPEYGIDFGDMQIKIHESQVEDVVIDGSTIIADVKKFSASERSGFMLSDMSSTIYVSSGVLCLENAKFVSRWSALEVPYLSLVDTSWSEYSKFIGSTEMDVDIASGYVSSDDVAYFSPSLRNWGLLIRSVKMNAQGNVDDLGLEIESLSFGEKSSLSASVHLQGLPTIEQTTADIIIEKLSTTSSDIDYLAASIIPTPLAQSTVNIIGELGEVSIEGEAQGTLGNMKFEGVAQSDLGHIEGEMQVVRDYLEIGGIALDGYVTAQNLELGIITGSSSLGSVDMRSEISGIASGKARSLQIRTHIDSVNVIKHDMQNISLDLHLVEDGIDGSVMSRDDKARFTLAGSTRGIFSSEGKRSCDLHLKLNKLDLAKLGINPRDSISILRGVAQLRASGSSLDDMLGELRLSDCKYSYPLDTIDVKQIEFTIERNGEESRINLNSSFADGMLYTKDKLSKVWHYGESTFSRFIPALYSTSWKDYARYDLSQVINPSGSIAAEEQGKQAPQQDKQSLLTLSLHNSESIVRAISPELSLGNDLRLAVVADTERDSFNASLKTSFLERKSVLATGLDVMLLNKKDSLMLSAKAKELFFGTMLMNNASVVAGAKQNRINVNAGFSNPRDSTSAIVGAMMTVGREANDKRTLSVQLTPSRYTKGGEEWHLQSKNVKVDSEGAHIDHLVLENASQHMIINGVASRSLRDSVTVDMRNFDLSILSSMIERLGYRVEGQTNGRIVASSVIDKARIEASVELDNVRVNNIASPNMNLRAKWDTSANRAVMSLLNRQSRDTLIRGYYIPSTVEYKAHLLVDSVDMRLLDPPLKGVIAQSTGHAKIDLTLEGLRRDAKLSGYITARNYSTLAEYTQVRYYAPEVSVAVSNNLLESKNIALNDGQGGEGVMDLRVDLSQLSNIGYELSLEQDELLVLDTSMKDNDLFYGNIRSSGVAKIKGSRSGVKMDVNATTGKDSKFIMPLAGKTNISQADFIKFKQVQQQDTLTELALRRLNFIKQTTTSQTPLTISMDLEVLPNTEVQLIIDPTTGDAIRTKGNGKFNITIEPKSKVFELYGDYIIDEGSYHFSLGNIVSKRFVINPGSAIQWTGSPTDSQLSIDALYKLKTSLDPLVGEADFSRAVPVDCIIRLRNSLSHPDVEFDIDLPTADSEQQAIISNLLNSQESISRQFFYLLISGNFIPETTSGTSSGLGTSTTAATGFELLANQLSNWLSTNNYSVILRYRPESEVTGEEIDVGFSTGWVDNRLQIEVAGNYISDTDRNLVNEEASNIMGEAHITWLIDPQGSLRIKGFTQTIDRYDENQGLQETGLGISYREDFEDFSDLRNRVKARFKRRKEETKKEKITKNN